MIGSIRNDSDSQPPYFWIVSQFACCSAGLRRRTDLFKTFAAHRAALQHARCTQIKLRHY